MFDLIECAVAYAHGNDISVVSELFFEFLQKYFFRVIGGNGGRKVITHLCLRSPIGHEGSEGQKRCHQRKTIANELKRNKVPHQPQSWLKLTAGEENFGTFF